MPAWRRLVESPGVGEEHLAAGRHGTPPRNAAQFIPRDVACNISGRIVGENSSSLPTLRHARDGATTRRRSRRSRWKLSKHSPVAKAMDYMLTRWALLASVLDDGRICLTNAAERALRGIAPGRKSWLFCGSDRGGDVHADRHRQAQRCRSPGLARRHAWAASRRRRNPASTNSSPETGSPSRSSIKLHGTCPRGSAAGPRPALHRRHHPSAPARNTLRPLADACDLHPTAGK